MIKSVQDGLLIKIKIVPNSSNNVIIIEDDLVKVKVTAQPVENKANKALISYLAEYLKVPKTAFDIVKGQTSKEKTIFIKIQSEDKKEEIINRLKK